MFAKISLSTIKYCQVFWPYSIFGLRVVKYLMYAQNLSISCVIKLNVTFVDSKGVVICCRNKQDCDANVKKEKSVRKIC